MANRIRGNVYLIDSGSINLTFPSSARIGTVAFYGADTTARLLLTLVSDSADAIVSFAANGFTSGPFNDSLMFGGKGLMVADTLRVHALVNGTGWIYFQ